MVSAPGGAQGAVRIGFRDSGDADGSPPRRTPLCTHQARSLLIPSSRQMRSSSRSASSRHCSFERPASRMNQAR